MFSLDSKHVEALHTIYLPSFVHISNSSGDIATNASECLYTVCLFMTVPKCLQSDKKNQ